MFNKTIREFKEFAVKGNVIDLAIAVVVGGAFGKIVSSLVSDIIMPFFGYFVLGQRVSNLKWVLREASEETALISVNYGKFILSIIDFLIIAISIFIIIKIYNKFRKNREKKEKEKTPKTNIQEELLREIRDILKQKI